MRPEPLSLLVVLMGFTPLFSVAACGVHDAPTTPAELHVYAFAESIPQEVLEGFHQHTGVSVVLTTYASNEELVAGLRAAPAAYDLVMPSDYAVDELVSAGALLPLDLASIPNYNNVAPAFLSPWFDAGGVSQPGRGRARNEKYSLPWLWGTTGIIFDSTVPGPAPARWADLWSPAFAGRLVLPDDAREMLGIGLLALGYPTNDPDPAHIHAAAEHLRPLVQGAVALDANTPETMLVAGPIHAATASAGVVYSGNAVLARRGNPALVYVLPQDGPGIWFDNLAIPAAAPHPEAAHQLIDWLLSEDSGAAVVTSLPYATPNEAAVRALKARDPARWSEYALDPVANPSMDTVAGAIPVKNVGAAAQAVYESEWAVIVGARGAK